MAVTVIKRPIGHKLSDDTYTFTLTNSGGKAEVDNDGSPFPFDEGYAYIESDIESYNGFKYLDFTFFDKFKLRDSPNSEYIDFKQEAEIYIRASILDHGWQCVHLPIAYDLSSDKYPLYQDDYAVGRYAVVVFDANGYSDIPLTDDITVDVLDYVRIINVNGDGPCDGVYQVIEITASDRITINLDPALAGLLTSDDIIVKYYNNYFISVNVYGGIGGLGVDHPWEDERTFEKLATLKFIPDSNNSVKFSISEILKGQITTRNNLTLDTLPNNIDFFTCFWITYWESYDSSDGTEITVHEGSHSSDLETFIGTAVNAITPFKSLNEGYLSDYVNKDDTLSRWLVMQDRPTAYVDRFFDVSFLLTVNSTDLIAHVDKLLNGVVTDTENIDLSNKGYGVIRVPITPSSGYDEYVIQVFDMQYTSQAITEKLYIDIIDECSSTFINDDLRLLEGGQFRELE